MITNSLSLLIKPVGPDCNLSCEYCFYLEKKKLFSESLNCRMDYSTLESVYINIAKSKIENIDICFQGGEPSLAGLAFYKQAIEFQNKYCSKINISNSLQTNGLLIDEDWADFLKINNFLVGLSIDGPKHIHDSYRCYGSGKSCFENVLKALHILQKHLVPVNALCCLTDISASHAEEIYEFFKSKNLLWMQFIPVVEKDKQNPNCEAHFSIKPKDYYIFLKKVFLLWINDFNDGEPLTHINYFESVFYTYLNLNPPDCTFQKTCGKYIVIEHNGNTYPCDFFVEKEFQTGNILHNNLIEILESPIQIDFGSLKSLLPTKCKKCIYYKHCYGGCTKDNKMIPPGHNIPRFCDSFYEFHKFSEPIFEKLANNWRINYAKKYKIKFEDKTYDATEDFAI